MLNRKALLFKFLKCRGREFGSTANRAPFPAPPHLPQRRVVVTGLGLVTPLGTGVEVAWRRLLEQHSGIRSLKLQDLNINGADAALVQQTMNQLPSQVVAAVPQGLGIAEFDTAKWLQAQDKKIAPFIAYALCASHEALASANWLHPDAQGRERTGVAIGGGIGCIGDMMEAAGLVAQQKLRRLSPYFIPRILINMAAGHVSIKYGFQGPNHAAVTACASGAHSIGDAARMIRFGDADVMVAGGAESSIDALSIAGFCRARALSTSFNHNPEKSSRPFDQDRDGFVMGEGAGIMVLEELQHALDRGATIYAELRGYGMSGDAHHITQPSAEGKGAILAMTRALQQSGLEANDVNYVNAHATSTPLGDVVEARAIQAVFKSNLDGDRFAFSSTKGATGHLLGAAGAVEAIFSVLALHEGIAPPTLNVEKPDSIFRDNFYPLTSARKLPIHAVLTNSFGFGGTNASLVFTCPPASSAHS